MQRRRTIRRTMCRTATLGLAALLASDGARAADPCGSWGMVGAPSPSEADDARLHGVHAISADDVWAVGHYQVPVSQTVDEHLTLTLHWDGSQWRRVPSPSPGLDYPGGVDCYLEAVDAVAADDVWAVGHFKTVNPAGGHVGQQPLALHWGGSSWEIVPAPFSKPESSGAFLHAVEAITSDDVWVGGLWPYPHEGAGGAAALMFHWDGSKWTSFDTPYVTGDGHRIRAISALASDDVWAVGEYDDTFERSYVIHWDGSTWSMVDDMPNPGTFNYLRDIAALAVDDIWITGEQWNPGSSYEPIMLHWDGVSWSVVPSPGGGTAIVALAADDIWSTDTWTTGQSIAHWDGTSWSAVDTVAGGGGATILALASVGGCEVWGVGRRPNGAYFLPLVERLEPSSSGDVDGDGVVGFGDVLLVLAAWGPCPACSEDVDGDGVVGFEDLLIVLSSWS